MQFGSAWPGADFQLIDKNAEITPDIHLLTLVSDKPGTLELREGTRSRRARPRVASARATPTWAMRTAGLSRNRESRSSCSFSSGRLSPNFRPRLLPGRLGYRQRPRAKSSRAVAYAPLKQPLGLLPELLLLPAELRSRSAGQC